MGCLKMVIHVWKGGSGRGVVLVIFLNRRISSLGFAFPTWVILIRWLTDVNIRSGSFTHAYFSDIWAMGATSRIFNNMSSTYTDTCCPRVGFG